MSNPEMMEALQALAVDKGISVDMLLGGARRRPRVGLQAACPSAYEYAWVEIDPDTGEIRVIAQELDEDGEPIGPEFDVTPPDDFGRIAAQTAKQVMMQRIREAEREMKYEEYAGREGDIVTGIIQQTDARYTLLDLGRVEALLPQAEQVPYERSEPGARLKAYIVEVRKTAKGPQIVVSRTHPGLIKRLFELEVPEIADGVVEIKACAREPGAPHQDRGLVERLATSTRSAPASGARGARVRMVVNELRGEKIDIVPFTDDPADFVMKALSPAKVKEVRIARGHRHRRGHRARLPAVARHRQGGPERPPRRPPHRLARRHQERDPAGRGRGLRDQDWAEGEWVDRPGQRRADVAAGRRRAHVRRAVATRPRAEEAEAEADRRGGGRPRPSWRRRSARRSTEAVVEEAMDEAVAEARRGGRGRAVAEARELARKPTPRTATGLRPTAPDGPAAARLRLHGAHRDFVPTAGSRSTRHPRAGGASTKFDIPTTAAPRRRRGHVGRLRRG